MSDQHKPPVTRERFLLWMLAAIFGFQATLFGFSVVKCSSFGPQAREVCPELGARYEKTFGVMIATVLALLGGSSVAAAAIDNRKPPSRRPVPPKEEK